MIRIAAAALALVFLAGAGPAHRQPTPQGLAEASAPSTDMAEAARRREAEDAAKSKVWDAKLKRTMGGVCRGC